MHERFRNVSKKESTWWPTSGHEFSDPKSWHALYSCEVVPGRIARAATLTFDTDWALDVPELITRIATLTQEKKRRELEFNLVQFAIVGLERRMQMLESLQTKIIPIDSFAPEPYVVLKPILIAVQATEEEFEASWFDANIHFSGGNEEEAVTNLKGFILDCFDNFSSKTPDKLGPEPIRQLAVMRGYIQKIA